MASSMMNSRLAQGGNRRRKRHELILPKNLDEPFGPPPEEYLYRCSVCSAEMLVNEAIIDVAVGAAKFRGEYTDGMPTIGCPGCNSETMAYCEQEP
jgi:DNA-directed RNA polymerase subunit RPC12/RpoP